MVIIEAGDRAVWVNDDTGCLGRFGRMGVDIHRTPTEQLDGKGQCLDCTHGPTGPGEWGRFVAGMVAFHGIDVPESYRPVWCVQVAGGLQ